MKTIRTVILLLNLCTLFRTADAKDTDAKLNQAYKYFSSNKIDSSEILFDALIKNSEDENIVFSALTGKFKIATYLLDLKKADSLLLICDTYNELPTIQKKVRLKYLQEKGEYYRASSKFAEALNTHKNVLKESKSLLEDTLIKGYALTYIAATYERMASYDSAIHYVNQAIDYFENYFDATDQKLGSIYNIAGSCYYRISDFNQAERYYKNSVSIYLKNVGNWSYGLAQAYSNLSNIYSAREDYLEAISYAEKSLAIHQHFEDIDGIAADYYSLAVYYYYLGDYGRCKDYCEMSIALRKKVYPNPMHFKHAYPTTVLAIAYEESGDYASALKYFKLAQQINQTNFQGGNINNAYDDENIALLYNLIGQHDSARFYIDKANQILPNKLSPNDLSLAVHYHSVALINLEGNNYQIALENAEKSCKIYEYLKLDHSIELAQNLALKAEILFRMDKIEPAQKEFKRAVSILGINEANIDSLFVPSALSLDVIMRSIKFNYYLFSQTKEEILLDQIIASSELYFDLCDKFRKQFNDPYTKSTIVKNNAHNFKTLSGIYYSLWNSTNNIVFKEMLFYLSEFSRTAFFRDMIDDYKIQHFSGLPDSILLREKEIKKNISQILQKSSENRQDSINQILFEQKEKLNNLTNLLLKDYPKYYNLRLNSEIISLEKVQSKLKPEEVVIEFVVDDTSYYALVLEEAQINIIKIGNLQVINNLIVNWRKQMLELNQNELKTSAYTLYKHLWQPMDTFVKDKSVIVIPTGKLFYLNFEALKPSLTEEKYLIHEYNITYALSLNVLFNAISANQSTYNNVLYIAPVFDDEMKNAYEKQLENNHSRDLTYLRTVRQPWSNKLGQKLKKKFKGKFVTHNNATESELKSVDLNASIVHFATHALSDEEDALRSRLVLAKDIGAQKNDGYLHAYEMFEIDLKTELTILNACESGVGNIKDGEGMISLAYAINYAGCPSTILSLWKIDEKANAEILNNFYSNLSYNMTINQALRKAKIDYINNSTKLMAHPYYWSGMILMGEDATLKIQKKWSSKRSIQILIGLVFFSILIFLYAAYKRK